jgi:hypothetical protein
MLTPRINKFYSRAELGMRAPKSVSHNITPEQGGCAVHYGGGGPNPAPTTFEKAKSIWLGWQNYHMDGQGWNDIAYTLGITQQGDVFAGRGAGVRTAAQGSDEGNDDYYAIVWIGGGDAVPSEDAKCAYLWAIKYLREKGNAGNRVRPHHDFTSTTCAGKYLSPFADSLDGKAINSVEEDVMATAEEVAKAVWDTLIPKQDGTDRTAYAKSMLGYVDIRTYRAEKQDVIQTAALQGLVEAVNTLAQGVEGVTGEQVLAKVEETVNAWLDKAEVTVTQPTESAPTPTP